MLPTRTFAYLKEGKELGASAKHRHRDLKVCYNSISSAAAGSELVFSLLIRRESGEILFSMVNRNKS